MLCLSGVHQSSGSKDLRFEMIESWTPQNQMSKKKKKEKKDLKSNNLYSLGAWLQFSVGNGCDQRWARQCSCPLPYLEAYAREKTVIRIGQTRKQVNDQLELWRKAFELNGLKLNISKKNNIEFNLSGYEKEDELVKLKLT